MRARNIKPDFFKNENLAEIPHQTRLLFIGLWCYADREGYLEARPKKIKAEIFPYEEINITESLATLAVSGFIHVYASSGNYPVIKILNFNKHQRPHYNEKPSILKNIIDTSNQGIKHLQPRKEALGSDIMIDDIMIPDIRNDDSKDIHARKPKKQKQAPVPIPECVAIYKDVFHYSLNPAARKEVESVVGSNGNLVLWREILTGWALKGWNPRNLNGMLECFKAGKIGDKPKFKSKYDENIEAIERSIRKAREANNGNAGGSKQIAGNVGDIVPGKKG